MRGVIVRIITAVGNCPTDRPPNDPTRRLAEAMRRDGPPGSWLRCVVRSGRGKGGTMHLKIVTISRTELTDDVTLVGSLNATPEANDDQWGDLVEFRGKKKVYRAYNWAFDNTARDVPMDKPYRAIDLGTDGLVRFYPLNRPKDPASDPVAQRLRGVPAKRTTTIWVANYAIHGTRGARLVDILAAKARGGPRRRDAPGTAAVPCRRTGRDPAGRVAPHASWVTSRRNGTSSLEGSTASNSSAARRPLHTAAAMVPGAQASPIPRTDAISPASRRATRSR